MKNIAAIALGGAAGYAWYRLVGCTGGCVITSNPWLSTIVGGLIGLGWSGGGSTKDLSET